MIKRANFELDSSARSIRATRPQSDKATNQSVRSSPLPFFPPVSSLLPIPKEQFLLFRDERIFGQELFNPGEKKIMILLGNSLN